jgi:hypothetical protein
VAIYNYQKKIRSYLRLTRPRPFSSFFVPNNAPPQQQQHEIQQNTMTQYYYYANILLYGTIYIYIPIEKRGYPIAGATFTQDGYTVQKLAAANVGTLGLILVILVRLYSGWGYIGSRLQSKVIEYEETGWYDGNLELKTEAEYKRDMFLYKSDVQPVVRRVKNSTLVVAALWVTSCIGLNTVVSMKPIFNEYDPELLNRVRYDDDVAATAAKASNGRPTYCDNRYYRAVANGGQGCN